MIKNERRWKTVDGHSPIIPFLTKISPLSKEAIEDFDTRTFTLFFEKKRFILKPGMIADQLFFLKKGVVHGFIKEEGRQITSWISEENQIIGSIRTLLTMGPCGEYLQAVEDCELIALPIAFLAEIYEKYREIQFICRRLWEHIYHEAEERACLVRISSAEKKYKKFLENHPGLINRIPLKYIASYLGMTMETLCRIRGRQNKH